MPSSRPRLDAGFTLVEIAIVLVIVGVLLGSVLKGQALITQAKIKNLANDLSGITTAVYAYEDRYRATPGDDAGARARWPDTDAAGASPGNGVIEADEQLLFWQHLRKAGFLTGDSHAGAPLNAVGGRTEALNMGLALSGTAICMHGLSAKIAEALDLQLDDGKPNTGTFRSTPEAASVPATAPAITSYTDDDSTSYVSCKQL